MTENFIPVVLCGGITSEKEPSLKSGRAMAKVIDNSILVELVENKLPNWLDPNKHFLVLALHGEYGEDGTIQKELEELNFAFTGSDSKTSELCMNKPKAKEVMKQVYENVLPEIIFNTNNKANINDILEKIGNNIIIKPTNKGSSINLYVANGIDEINNVLSNINDGEYMIEKRLIGREFTIGLLNGKALGIVEIFAPNGINSYEFKYSSNKVNKYPAELPHDLEINICETAEKIYKICNCRDYCRMDLILDKDGKFYFLEINTLPGMTETSLLPKSALCKNMNFKDLVYKMIEPAIVRMNNK